MAAGRECTRPASSTSPLPPPSVMAPSLSRCRFSPPRTRQESGGSGGDPNGGEITGGGPLLRPAQRHHSLATDVTSPATCHPGTAISANAAGASPAVMTAPLPPAFLNGGHGGGGGERRRSQCATHEAAGSRGGGGPLAATGRNDAEQERLAPPPPWRARARGVETAPEVVACVGRRPAGPTPVSSAARVCRGAPARRLPRYGVDDRKLCSHENRRSKGGKEEGMEPRASTSAAAGSER